MNKPLGFRALVILSVAFAPPALLQGGANSWTGGRPIGPSNSQAKLVAADPSSPNVVSAAFGPDIYLSSDGGRSLSSGLASSAAAEALVLDPTDSSTLFVELANRPSTRDS